MTGTSGTTFNDMEVRVDDRRYRHMSATGVRGRVYQAHTQYEVLLRRMLPVKDKRTDYGEILRQARPATRKGAVLRGVWQDKVVEV